MGSTVFLPSPIYGGPATVAFNQARGLVKRGHAVTVATSDVMSFRPRTHFDKNEDTLDGVEVKYFRSRILRPKFPFIVSGAMKTWLRANIFRFDVVHVHFARDWIPITMTQQALKAKVPVYLQPHGMLSRRDGVRKVLDRLLIADLLTKADRVLVLQEHEQGLIEAIAPVAKTKILPNGVELPARSTLWNSPVLERPRILFLARLHPRKRVMDFLGAARLLRDRGLDLSFRIVGPDQGDLSEALRHVKAFRLDDRVQFIGQVDQDTARREYADANLYVLPAVDEPFPMTVLEALSVGTPTIVTTSIAIRTLLESSGAAMIVDPGPEAIAAGIQRVIESPELAKTLSANGVQLIEKELNLESVIGQLEGVYQQGF
jgi:glycosyltransferase involved in cell wall biosynthesis